jgi:drug/metabolite transporter (DMT)-like permease
MGVMFLGDTILPKVILSGLVIIAGVILTNLSTPKRC